MGKFIHKIRYRINEGHQISATTFLQVELDEILNYSKRDWESKVKNIIMSKTGATLENIRTDDLTIEYIGTKELLIKKSSENNALKKTENDSFMNEYNSMIQQRESFTASDYQKNEDRVDSNIDDEEWRRRYGNEPRWHGEEDIESTPQINKISEQELQNRKQQREKNFNEWQEKLPENNKTAVQLTYSWANSNLAKREYNDGTLIPHANSSSEWIEFCEKKLGCWCYRDFNNVNESEGYYYNWYAISSSKGIAPTGYKIPNNADWEKLIDDCGGKEIAGGKLKSEIGWATYLIYGEDHNGNGNNVSGLALKPNLVISKQGSSKNEGMYGEWWSLNETNFIEPKSSFWSRNKQEGYYANANTFNITNTHVISIMSRDKQYGLQVRCVKIERNVLEKANTLEKSTDIFDF